VAVLLLAGCGEDDGEETQSWAAEPPEAGFNERAARVAEAWPEAVPAVGRFSDLLPLDGVRHADGGDRSITVNVGHTGCVMDDFGAMVHETQDMVVVSG
jgi:hypothetical protein